MTVVLRGPEQIEPSGSADGSVKTNVGDCVADVYPGLVNSEVLLRLCIVMERNSSCCGKRHKPIGVVWAHAQRARPNTSLVVPKILEALPDVSDSTSWRHVS